MIPRRSAIQLHPGTSWDDIADHLETKEIWFVGGAHKSGTTLLRDILARVDGVSTFTNTGAPSDEGQHLQDVLLPDLYFGEILFGLSDEAYESEVEPDQVARQRVALARAWVPWWDISRPRLLEKSPINLIRTRFLQSVFPLSRFIVIARDPRTAFLAARKTMPQLSFTDYLTAWERMYDRFESDSLHLGHSILVRFENLVSDPRSVMESLSQFLEAEVHAPDVLIRNKLDSYRDLWMDHRQRLSAQESALLDRVKLRFGYDLDS